MKGDLTFGEGGHLVKVVEVEHYRQWSIKILISNIIFCLEWSDR